MNLFAAALLITAGLKPCVSNETIHVYIDDEKIVIGDEMRGCALKSPWHVSGVWTEAAVTQCTRFEEEMPDQIARFRLIKRSDGPTQVEVVLFAEDGPVAADLCEAR